MMNLEECRKKIDGIDDQILQLYLERMGIVISVAEYKQQNNLPILHSKREQEIIQKQMERSPEQLKMFVEEFFQTIMKTSREYQSLLLK